MRKEKHSNIISPQIPPTAGIELLRGQIKKAEQLINSATLSQTTYEAWRTTLHDILRKAFGEPSETVDTIISAGNCLAFFGMATQSDLERERKERLHGLIEYIKEAMDQLNIKLTLALPSTSPTEGAPKKAKNSVFIVHGHDGSMRSSVSSMLDSQGIKNIILSQVPNEGLTVIEKLEREAEEVDYAIVLMTGDDIGKAKSDPPEKFFPRARQNVILELGLFIGKLKRDRIAILYEQDVELPSDITGVIYIKIDPSGAWKYQLGNELRKAGLTFDLNQIK